MTFLILGLLVLVILPVISTITAFAIVVTAVSVMEKISKRSTNDAPF